MSSRPRVVLITADGRRHLYAARTLQERVDLVGVVLEEKCVQALQVSDSSPSDRRVIDRHLAERDRVEARYLGETVAPPATEVLRVGASAANDASTLQWIERRAPEVVVLYGCSLIREPLLGAFVDRIVNLHLGLSPYYRGSGTNFWPLVFREPECVGATVHLATREIDGGPILAQIRPEADPSDEAHDLGTKALISGLELVPPAVEGLLRGRLRLVPQDPAGGRLCRRRDFVASAVERMWQNLASGMVAEYLAEREERDARFPIVRLPG